MLITAGSEARRTVEAVTFKHIVLNVRGFLFPKMRSNN